MGVRKQRPLDLGVDSRFDFYEKVRVRSSDPSLRRLDGEVGVTLGKQRGAFGQWRYAVVMYRDTESVILAQSDLESTGESEQIERIYPLRRQKRS